MVSLRETESTALRTGKTVDGRPLAVDQREKLVQRYLPPPFEQTPTKPLKFPAKAFPLPPRRSKRRRRTIRELASEQLYILVFTVVHVIFSFYLLLRRTYHTIINRILTVRYYHYRTPGYIQKDVKGLDKLPQHLSVIVELEDEDQNGADALFNNVGEISAWAAAAEIPLLSVYEKTGKTSSANALMESVS